MDAEKARRLCLVALRLLERLGEGDLLLVLEPALEPTSGGASPRRAGTDERQVGDVDEVTVQRIENPLEDVDQLPDVALSSTITDPKGTRSRTSARSWKSIPRIPGTGTAAAPPVSREDAAIGGRRF
jgi:hypothetical protein